jgi:thiol-disulfide isomerase/thioredoxin
MWRAASWTMVVALVLSSSSTQPPREKPGERKRIEGELMLGDPLDARLKHPSNVHEIKLTKGESVVIRLNSNQFDAYLIVQDSAKKELAFNDDDPDEGTLNSKLIFTAPKDDTYLLVATSLDNKVGKYELIIEAASEKLKEFSKLQADHQAATEAATKKLQTQYRDQLIELEAQYIVKANAFAEANADDPVGKSAAKQVSNLLMKAGQFGTPSVVKHLRTLAETAKSKEVRGQALLALAEVMQQQFEEAAKTKDKEQAAKLNAETIALFNEVLSKYGGVQSPFGPLAGKANDALFVLTKLAVGKTAPDMEGEEIDGKMFKLSDFRGKVTAVYFWGSWCGPCREMIPHERELAHKHEKVPFALVGINTDNNKDKAKEFLQQEKISWTQVWDGGSTTGPLSSSWKVQAFPTIYVLDGNGVIRLRSVGDPGAEFERVIDELLADLKK